ncbi:MAG: hypothetical protein ACREN8_06270 [Candidatus Dormibacteraceae bacterium]
MFWPLLLAFLLGLMIGGLVGWVIGVRLTRRGTYSVALQAEMVEESLSEPTPCIPPAPALDEKMGDVLDELEQRYRPRR